MKEYKDTLLMPKTDFPMRGNLGVNEIPIQKKWEEDKIYEKVLKKNEGKQPFICMMDLHMLMEKFMLVMQ